MQNTIPEMRNVFTQLITRLNTVEEKSVNLKMNGNFTKLNAKRKNIMEN